MTNKRLNVTRAQRALIYNFSTSEDETIGRLARFLSQQDDRLETGTLEIAYPINKLDPLSNLNLQTSDRIVLLEATQERSQEENAFASGYKMLYFRSSTLEISSGGKNILFLGQPDSKDAQYLPDVDLSFFVAPDDLASISRRSVKMEFDKDRKNWKVERVGKTPVMVDDLALGEKQSVNVERKFQLRFYRANRVIASIEVDIQLLENTSNQTQLQGGNFPIHVTVALEKSNVWLNVTEALPLHQIAESLSHYWRMGDQYPQALYMMRLLSPDTELKTLPIDTTRNIFLYAGKHYKSVYNTLRLINTSNSDLVFEQKARSGEVKIDIGVKQEDESNSKKLDLNLYLNLNKVMTEKGQRDMIRVSKVFATITYRENNGTWWLTAEERNPLSIFVNSMQLQSGKSHPLDIESVITFGSSITDYYSRLQVVLDTTAD